MFTSKTSNPRSVNCLETGISSINARYDSDTAEVVVAVNGHRSGRIKRDGISWKAVCKQGLTFFPGDEVHVIGRVKDKLILLIGPLEGSYV